MTADGGADAEDAKLRTLARAARVRTGAAEGAAVRDGIGRTYAAASVDLAALRLSALQAAVAAAVSSGAEGIEVAAVDGRADLAPDDAALVAELELRTVLLDGADEGVGDR